jgi:hypothetical protein
MDEIKTFKCKKCNEIKEIECFLKNKNLKNGIRYTCKECNKKHFKKYNNSTKRKKYLKEYREQNKEKIREQLKEYYNKPENKIKHCIKQKEYYHNPINKNKIKSYHEEYRKTDKYKQAFKNIKNKYKEENHNKSIIDINKQCSKCHEIKHSSDFFRDPLTKDGLSCYCKKCRKSYDRKEYFRKYMFNRIKRTTNKRKLTQDEFNFIKDNYQTKTVIEISKMLNKHPNTIYKYISIIKKDISDK